MKKFYILLLIFSIFFILVWSEGETNSDRVKIITQKGDVQLKNLPDRRVIIYEYSEITYRDIYFKADVLTIEIMKASDLTTVTGEGNVRVEDGETGYILTGGRVDYNSEKDLIIVTENPAIKNDKKKIEFSSREIRYYRKEGLAEGLGKARLKYRQYTGTGDKVLFRDKQDSIQVLGKANIKRKDGSFLKGEDIRIFSRDTLIVKGSGSLKILDMDTFTNKGSDPKSKGEPFESTFDFLELRDKDTKIYMRYGNIQQGKDWIEGEEIYIDYYYPKGSDQPSVKELIARYSARAHLEKDDSTVDGFEIILKENQDLEVTSVLNEFSKVTKGDEYKLTAVQFSRHGETGLAEGLVKVESGEYVIYAQKIRVNETEQSGTAEGYPYFIRNRDRLYGDKINFSENTIEIIDNGYGWSYLEDEDNKPEPKGRKPSIQTETESDTETFVAREPDKQGPGSDPDAWSFITFSYLYHDREKKITRLKDFTIRDKGLYMQADNMELLGPLGKFESGYGEGNVRIIDFISSSMVTGDSFRYDGKNGDIFLIGRCDIVLGEEAKKEELPFIIQTESWVRDHITEAPADKKIEVEGYNLTYNRQSKESSISNAKTFLDPWYIDADRILQVRNDLFWLEDTDITSCDHDLPHYYLRVKRLKVYTNDKVIARNMIGYFGGAPLLYFPYFIKDTDKNDSRWVVYLGQNQYEGYYWKNKFLFDMFRDRAHLALKFDYMSELDWGRGFNYRYSNPQSGFRGYLNHYFNEDRINFSVINPATGEQETRAFYKTGYKWRGEHIQNLPLNSTLRIYLDRFSDPDFNQNHYSDQVEEVSKRTEETYVSVSNSYRGLYSLEVLNQEKTNFYNDIETSYRKLPDLRFSLISQKLPLVPVNFSMSTRYINYWNEMYIQGGNSSLSLNTESFKLFKIISTGFQITENIYYVDKTQDSPENLWAKSFTGSINTSTKAWRIFNPQGIRKFKHTISPRLSYNYTYVPELYRDISRDQYRFTDFISVPISGKSNRVMGIALNQDLQMKKEEKVKEEEKQKGLNDLFKTESEPVTSDIRNIIRLEMSTSYNIDNDLWSDLSSLLSSSFIKNFNLGLRVTNDVYDWKLKSLSLNLNYNDKEHLQVTSNLLYYPESSEFKTTMSNRIDWILNDDFNMYFYSRYNFIGRSDFWHRLSSKEIGIEHSLHCWLLSVSWRQNYNLLVDGAPESENIIWFKIMLRAERSNRFSIENNFVSDEFSIMGNKTASPF